MIRILHITRDFPPESRGGISSAVGGMVEALSDHGDVECRVISFDGWRPKGRSAESQSPPAESREKEAQVFRIRSAAGTRKAFDFALESRPQILHVHHGMLWDFARSIREYLRVPAVKSVHVLQAESGRILGLKQETLSRLAQETALLEADAIIAPARGVAEILARDYPSTRAKIRVAGFGIHDSDAARKSAANRRYGGAGPVLYVGRFSETKGTPDLFRAIPLIMHRHPGSRVLVVGGIPDSPKMERRWRRKLTGMLPEPFRQYVEFTGWVSGEELASLYAVAGVLASPSLVETYGLAVLEAMLHGLPVAGTGTPGTSELVIHGKTGLLSEPRDFEGLAANISHLIENVAFAEQTGRNGADAVRANRLWKSCIQDFLDVYGEQLGGSV